MKLKNYLFIILILAILLFFTVNLSPYPKNPEKWFEIRYYIGGNLECLIPSPVTSSSVDLYLTRNEIDIRKEISKITKDEGIDIVIVACSSPEAQKLALD
ncbi:MAG: hypothetical protein KKF67_01235, partial [Nanoarchaeota archaeon]|nr:hypothetical protein [Nanoarchaeota archaeon]